MSQENEAPTSPLRFVHRFGSGIICEITVPTQAPPQGSQFVLNIEWTGRIRRKHINQYRQRVLSTIQILAERWNQKIAYCLGVSSRETEFWAFEPGAAPKLIKTIPVGI